MLTMLLNRRCLLALGLGLLTGFGLAGPGAAEDGRVHIESLPGSAFWAIIGVMAVVLGLVVVLFVRRGIWAEHAAPEEGSGTYRISPP